MFGIRKTLASLLLVAATAITLIGCGNGDDHGSNDSSRVRVFNAVVGAPASVNLAQRNANLTSLPLTFGQLAPAISTTQGQTYGTVASGTSITTTAFLNGSSTAIPGNPNPETVDFINTHSYTVAIAGLYNSSQADATYPVKIYRFEDTYPDLQNNTKAAIRVIHLSPGAPAVSVFNTAGTPPTAIAVTGLTNLTYSTSSNYVLLDPTVTYNLSLRDNTGANITLPASTANTLSAFQPAAGAIYTVFAVGQPNAVAPNQAFDLVVTRDN